MLRLKSIHVSKRCPIHFNGHLPLLPKCRIDFNSRRRFIWWSCVLNIHCSVQNVEDVCVRVFEQWLNSVRSYKCVVPKVVQFNLGDKILFNFGTRKPTSVVFHQPSSRNLVKFRHIMIFAIDRRPNLLMASCKTVVTPLLTQCSYCSLALSRRYYGKHNGFILLRFYI